MTSSISMRFSASVAGTGLSEEELRLRVLSSLHLRPEVTRLYLSHSLKLITYPVCFLDPESDKVNITDKK
jgi:hypothetical protein